MPLKNATDNAASTAAFETEDDNVIENAADTQAAEVAATPVASTSTALSKPAGGALTARAVVASNVLMPYKDAFHVDFDSTPAISANQGSFSFKDTEEELGNEITIDLMSFQDGWVAGPSDNKAPIETVKWSDDGITSRDGFDMQKWVEDLKAQGYTKAKIAHRNTIVGELVKAGVETERMGMLVQIDLPDSGRKAFNAYQLQASFAVGKGRKTAEEAKLLKMKAVKDKTKSGDVYTKVQFL